MAFGRELYVPCDLMFETPPDKQSILVQYVSPLEERCHIHKLAWTNLNLVTSTRIKTWYDLTVTASGCDTGDQVWLYNPNQKKGLNLKLRPPWGCSYTVIKRTNNVVYRIQRIVGYFTLKSIYISQQTDPYL